MVITQLIRIAGMLLAVTLLAVALAGCGSEGGSEQLSDASGQPHGAEWTGREYAPLYHSATEDDFIFRVESAKSEYIAGEPIVVKAMLKYEGEHNEITIFHAASPFWFHVTETALNAHIPTAMDQPGLQTKLRKGEWLIKTYVKSALLWGDASDNGHSFIENLDFIREFAAADGFPPGQYQIKVRTDFSLLSHRERTIQLTDEVQFTVRPSATTAGQE